MLQGSIACSSGLQGLYFLKLEKIAMGHVWAPGLQAFKMMGSRAPATPFGGLEDKTCVCNDHSMQRACNQKACKRFIWSIYEATSGNKFVLHWLLLCKSYPGRSLVVIIKSSNLFNYTLVSRVCRSLQRSYFRF